MHIPTTQRQVPASADAAIATLPPAVLDWLAKREAEVPPLPLSPAATERTVTGLRESAVPRKT